MYKHWADFARDAKVLPAALSNWKDGNGSLSGDNLLKLIQAAQRRTAGAMWTASMNVDPVFLEAVQIAQGLREEPAKSVEAVEAAEAARTEAYDRLREELVGLLGEQAKETNRSIRALAKEVRAQAPQPKPLPREAKKAV